MTSSFTGAYGGFRLEAVNEQTAIQRQLLLGWRTLILVSPYAFAKARSPTLDRQFSGREFMWPDAEIRAIWECASSHNSGPGAYRLTLHHRHPEPFLIWPKHWTGHVGGLLAAQPCFGAARAISSFCSCFRDSVCKGSLRPPARVGHIACSEDLDGLGHHLDLIRKVAALRGEMDLRDPDAWYRSSFGKAPDYSHLLYTLATAPP